MMSTIKQLVAESEELHVTYNATISHLYTKNTRRVKFCQLTVAYAAQKPRTSCNMMQLWFRLQVCDPYQYNIIPDNIVIMISLGTGYCV